MGCLNYGSTLAQRLYKIIFKELKEEDSCLFLIYKDLEGFYYVIKIIISMSKVLITLYS